MFCCVVWVFVVYCLLMEYCLFRICFVLGCSFVCLVWDLFVVVFLGDLFWYFMLFDWVGGMVEGVLCDGCVVSLGGCYV